MDEREHFIEELAGRQLGRFTRRQVERLAGDPETARALVRKRLRSDRWRRETTRVIVLPGAPTGALAEIWTAHLHVGDDSVVSHMSAAGLWELPAVPESTPSLIVPSGSNRRYARGRLYQRGDLGGAQVTAIGNLPVTTVPRTLADLAPHVARPRMEAWVDHAIGERLTSMRELRADVELLGRSRKVLEPLTTVLADRLPGSGIEASMLERALTAILALANISTGIAQHEAPGRSGDPMGLVDRAWPELRWVVEADGRRWHAREASMVADRARDRAAQAVGWVVTRLTYDDIVNSPDATAEDLTAVHAQRVADSRRWRRRRAG